MAFEHHGMSAASAAFLAEAQLCVGRKTRRRAASARGSSTAAGSRSTSRTPADLGGGGLVGVAELLFALGGGAGAGALRAFRARARASRGEGVQERRRRPERALLATLLESPRAARDLACVALVFVFVFAILGMHIFGGAAPFGGRPFGKHFDDVFSASVAVFEMLTASQWRRRVPMGDAPLHETLYPTCSRRVDVRGPFLFLDVLLARMLAFNFARGDEDIAAPARDGGVNPRRRT